MSDKANSSEAFDRNVYILGAGFSAAAGAPLLNNFLDVAASLWEDPDSDLSEDQRADFRRVFDFRRELAQAREKVHIDLDNVEHLFGLIDIAERISSDMGPTKQAILTLIATTLELKTNRSLPVIGVRPRNPVSAQFEKLDRFYQVFPLSSPPEYHASIYSHFAALLGGLLDAPEKRRRRRDAVITFNYDLVLDRALKQVNIDFDYCLNGPVPNDQPATISLIKLHGSINWTVCSNCGSLRITDPSEKSQRRSACGECRQLMSPLLIPPSWNKASSNSHGNEYLVSLWRAADEALSTATRICIIGYSVPETDAFFRYLLTLALARNHHLNALMVVDPSTVVNEKFESLLEPIFRGRRYEFFSAVFEQVLGDRLFYDRLRRGNEGIANFNLYGPANR